MKRLLVVPILALAATLLAPAAQANHGGAQSPDINEAEDKCELVYVFHASCEITSETDAKLNMRARAAGVPTADGWHVKIRIRLVDNVNGEVLRDLVAERMKPYTTDWFGTGVPHPNSPTFGLGTSSPGDLPTTDATCMVDVEAGSGRAMRCAYWNDSGTPWVLIPHIPGPV